VPQLHLAEVGFEPQAADGHDRHERRARGDAFTELRAAPRQVTGHRRAHTGAHQREPGALHLRGSGAHIGIVGNSRAPHQCTARSEVLLRGEQRIAGSLEGVLSMAELLTRDRTARGEVAAPIEVRLRSPKVGAALGNHGAQLIAIGEHGMRLTHGACELLLGILQGDTRIGGIEPYQLLPSVDPIGLVRPDRDDGTAHL